MTPDESLPYFIMVDRIANLLGDLARAGELRGAELARAQRRAAWVAELSPDALDEFLAAITALSLPLSPAADSLLAGWLTASVQARRSTTAQAASGSAPPHLESLYRALGSTSRARAQLLAWLAVGSNDDELHLLGRLLVDDPPTDDADVVQALAPLFQRRSATAAALFPQLLGGLRHATLAAPVLDLANFLTREQLVGRHPAAERVAELTALLGQLVQSLLQLEERPEDQSISPQELSRRVARSVALAVSLCDALGLIGDPLAIGKLNQALEVRHRRVQTEVAAALSRLGEQRGTEKLVELAAEPVARLRVLAYAQELGIEDKVDPKYKTDEARAEAQLCLYLAEPTQYGLPPSSCELFDRRRQHWPGFVEPVECFLFRFQYVVTVGDEERSFSNVGIAGPLAHAFVADLADLPPDDIYAAFAGWQAAHEEIREYEVARLSKSEQLEVERLKRRLHDAGYVRIEPQRMGYFFGDKALVAIAERTAVEGESAAGVAIADFESIAFFPTRGGRRSLGPDEAYCIYKGRKLLAAFNR